MVTEGTPAEARMIMRCDLSSIQRDGTFGCGKQRYSLHTDIGKWIPTAAPHLLDGDTLVLLALL